MASRYPPENLLGLQPVLQAHFREGFKIAVGGCDCQVHVLGLCSKHHVDLRQYSAAAAKLPEYLAVNRRNFGLKRPEPHTAQQSAQCAAECVCTVARGKR